MRAVRKIQAITWAMRALLRREVVLVFVHLVPHRYMITGFFRGNLLSSSLPLGMRGILPQFRPGQSELALLSFKDFLLYLKSAADCVRLGRLAGLNSLATWASWCGPKLDDIAFVDLT